MLSETDPITKQLRYRRLPLMRCLESLNAERQTGWWFQGLGVGAGAGSGLGASLGTVSVLPR